MIPFDPITGASLLIMAASGANLCQIPKPAQINVIPRTENVKYDYSQSHAAIQSYDIDTINPYGYSNVTHTNGFMKGTIAMRSTVKLDSKPLQRYRAHCIWYDTIDIEIEIDPTIVIASEVAADPCMKKAVQRHELKHVKVDRILVNKYAKTIGKKVFEGLKQRGFIAGPISPENAQATAQRMRDTVSQLMALEYKKLEIDRAEAQQAVDSLGEYKRVQALCPNFISPAARSGAQ